MFIEGQVVMLPTTEKSNIPFHLGKDVKLRVNHTTTPSPFEIPHHLYVLSHDIVNIGNMVYDLAKAKVGEFNGFQSNGGDFSDHCRKIIATTDESISLPINCEPYCPNKNCLGGVITYDGATGNLCKKCNPHGTQYPKPTKAFIELYCAAYNAGTSIFNVVIEYREYMGGHSIKHVAQKQGMYKLLLKISEENTINILKHRTSWTKKDLGETIEYLLDTIVMARACVRDKNRSEALCERIDERLTDQIVKLREEGLLGS